MGHVVEAVTWILMGHVVGHLPASTGGMGGDSGHYKTYNGEGVELTRGSVPV